MTRCQRCGQDNPEGFRFCGSCGAPIAQTPADAREERKVVSVLFCDLVGFTSRSERADPEDVRATRAAIEFEQLPPASLKGKAEPVPAWRALAATSRADVEHRASTPLVGRAREMSLLEGLFGRALEEARVQLVTISGEPGVGKS